MPPPQGMLQPDATPAVQPSAQPPARPSSPEYTSTAQVAAADLQPEAPCFAPAAVGGDAAVSAGAAPPDMPSPTDYVPPSASRSAASLQQEEGEEEAVAAQPPPQLTMDVHPGADSPPLPAPDAAESASARQFQHAGALADAAAIKQEAGGAQAGEQQQPSAPVFSLADAYRQAAAAEVAAASRASTPETGDLPAGSAAQTLQKHSSDTSAANGRPAGGQTAAAVSSASQPQQQRLASAAQRIAASEPAMQVRHPAAALGCTASSPPVTAVPSLSEEPRALMLCFCKKLSS